MESTMGPDSISVVTPYEAPPPAHASRRHKRGFASMSKDRRREIASLGGKAVQAKGTGHQWTSESATTAGRKGGLATHRSRGRKVS